MEEENPANPELNELAASVAKAKQDLSVIESAVANANRLIAVIEDYNQKFESIRLNLDDPSTGLIANLEKSKNSQTEIDSLRNKGEEELTKIKAVLATVQQNIQQMNDAFAEFTQINSRITNSDTGLDAVLKRSNQVKSEIDTLRIAADQNLAQIKQELEAVQLSIKQMSDAYVEFNKIKTQIDHPTTGLKKIFDDSALVNQDILGLRKDSEQVLKEIRKFNSESLSLSKEIDDIKVTSEESKNAIGVYEKDSQDLRLKIEHIYKIATDKALANAFDKRRTELEVTTGWWLKIVIASMLFLLTILILLFVVVPLLSKQAILTFDNYSLVRLSLTTPIFFFLFFATVEYSKERNFLEKYAFKSATALSLEGYTTLLINTFDKNNKDVADEILQFVIKSMTMIYLPPHDALKESKISLGLDGKFATFKADMIQTMEKTVTDSVKKVVKGNH